MAPIHTQHQLRPRNSSVFSFQVHFVPTKIISTGDFIQLLALIQWVCPLEREHFYTSYVEKVFKLGISFNFAG